MGLTEDAKKKYKEITNTVKESAEKAEKDIDITKQRIDGEIDKAYGHKVTGEMKIQTAKVKEKLNQ